MPKKKREPKRYVNQKAVTIHKEISHTKGEYFTLDIKKNNKAMRELSSIAYKMYVYLCEFQTGTTQLISCSQFMKAAGVSNRSYQFAKQELIKKRYLIEREDGDYDFYNYQYHVVTEQEKIINEIIAKDKAKAVAE